MGLETLIAAASLPDFPSATVVIIGAGSLASRLRAFVADLGIGDRVSFLGSVSDVQLVDWYRAADVFVLPTIAYEGFGMVTAEALATGTPVVGTPIGATPELLRPLDARLVTNGTAPRDLAASLSEALAVTGPGFRRRCREYAVNSLSWQNVIPLWEAALAQVCG